MQLYTKILIGMAVGTVVGLTVGPKSTFLDHDLYQIDDASKVTFVRDYHPNRGAPTETLPFPPGAAVDFKQLDLAFATKTDLLGQKYEVVVAVLGRFKFTKKLALRDKNGSLASALGNPDLGDSRDAWLLVEQMPLKSGGFVPSQEPVSGLGVSLSLIFAFIGELFLRLIKMVIVPLVFASLLVGIAGLGDVRKLGRLGGKTLGLYLGTTACAVTIGLLVAHAVKPGNYIDEKDRAALTAKYADSAGDKVDKAAEAPSMADNVLLIIPDNPIASFSNANMLQIIFFTLIFGIALTLLDKERAGQVVAFFDTIQHAMIMIIHMVMALAPFGVAALLAETIGQSGISLLVSLLVYALTVLLGLAILAGGVYGMLVKFFAKLPLSKFFRAARPAQLIAFSTSSSSAALPITLECAEENLGVSNSVSSFVVPLGSTVNMDGTALYQGVAALFIAQVFQIDLSIGDQLGIVFAATAASIGAAGVPGAGMITLAMVLTGAGIPTVGVALILGVDRILDMFRTSVNVTGDLAVASVIAVSEGETLTVLSPTDDAKNPDRGFEGRLEREAKAINPDESG